MVPGRLPTSGARTPWREEGLSSHLPHLSSFIPSIFWGGPWWVFIVARRLSLVVASRLLFNAVCRLLIAEHGLQSADSEVEEHRLSCSTARGIFPDQGLNLCLLLWHVDSLQLDHKECPKYFLIKACTLCFETQCYYILNKIQCNINKILVIASN